MVCDHFLSAVFADRQAEAHTADKKPALDCLPLTLPKSPKRKLDFHTARNEDEQWEARKTMARLEQIAAQEYGFAYADELHEKEIGRKGL